MDIKYTSLFKSLVSSFSKLKTSAEEQNTYQTASKTNRQTIENARMLLNGVVEESNNDSMVVISSKESLLNSPSLEGLSISYNSQNSFDDTNNKTIGVEKNIQKPLVDNHKKDELFNQIKSLHCLFTWNLKPQTKQNIISLIKNKYGSNDLDLLKYLPTPEFTFVR